LFGQTKSRGEFGRGEAAEYVRLATDWTPAESLLAAQARRRVDE
jgi:hypothetical protein